MDMDFAVSCPLVRHWRLISGFCPSTRTFDPCFFQTPPRGGSPCIITRPSPPSGWPEDLHLQAAEHAQHTTRPAKGPAADEGVRPTTFAGVRLREDCAVLGLKPALRRRPIRRAGSSKLRCLETAGSDMRSLYRVSAPGKDRRRARRIVNQMVNCSGKPHRARDGRCNLFPPAQYKAQCTPSSPTFVTARACCARLLCLERSR